MSLFKLTKNAISNRISLYLFFAFALFVLGNTASVSAEEFVVSIPYGAFNPELNTPAEVWYDPPYLSVNVGDTVTWTNDDREGHTVTSGETAGRFDWMNAQKVGEPDGIFDSGRFMPDESWSYTFEEEGSFPYYCIIHPWMGAVIIVQQSIPDYPHDATGKKIDEWTDFKSFKKDNKLSDLR